MSRIIDIKDSGGPKIGIYSFGSKSNCQIGAQFEFDVSELRDPTGQKQFDGKDGRDIAVRNWVAKDKRVSGIVHQCLLLSDDLVKPKRRETSGVIRLDSVSNWLSFSFVDHHGKWTSPAVAEIVADALDEAGYTVYVVHDFFKVR